MNAEAVALTVAAALFSVVNGANDGGAALAPGLTVRLLRPWISVCLMAAAVFVVPWLGGTAVARTLATGLVPSQEPLAVTVFVAAVCVSIVVASLLSAKGLPTSLTLALVGAVAGAGLGAGLGVAWAQVAGVLLVAAAAPVVGVGVGWALSWLAQRIPVPEGLPARLRWLHAVAFALQCVAYGANDGQKMFAVFLVAMGAGESQQLTVPRLALVAVLFGLGAALGVRRMASTVGRGLLPVRPTDAVTTELSAGSVVLVTAGLGAPVSMTQAMSGSLVGIGVSGVGRRVRWRAALRIGRAWVITLPVAFLVALAVGVVLRW